MGQVPYITAVISAAGRGRRMGWNRNKLMMKLDNMLIVERTVSALKKCPLIKAYVLVIRPEDEEEIKGSIIPGVFSEDDVVLTTYGGETREESTWNGIKVAPEETEMILYHDGARPFITVDVIERVINTLIENKADGAIPVVPVKDTIKVLNADKYVETTPNRERLVAVQTPQAFWKDKLISAYKNARSENIATTDDAQIVEVFGGKIVTTEGSFYNIKITTPEDLLVGESIILEQ